MNRLTLPCSLLALAFSSLTASQIFGASFIVTKTADTNGTCNSGVNCSLREAINASNAASGPNTITFAAGVTGTIGLTSQLPLININVTIQGPGPTQLEVTRSSGTYRIFTVNNASALTISGLAITNGHAVNQHNPDVFESGGAIDTGFGNVTLTNCILSGNTGDGGGGAIVNNGGDQLTLTNCVVSNNSSGATGGAIQNFGTVTLTSCTFSGNTATTDGGAIVNGNIGFNSGGPISVSGCTFNGNSAVRGGAIFIYNNSLNIQNSTLASNTASNSGGAIENFSDSTSHTAPAQLFSVTIGGNSASAGGGIYNDSNNTGNASVSLQNTILQSTAQQPGANLVNVNGPASRIASLGYNLSSDNAGGFLNNGGDQINVDPLLGPLQNNGGPTNTMALMSGSPARDKGKSFGVATDQRGSPRPIDDPSISNAPGGDGADIGAFEVDPSQSSFTLTVTTTDDHNDGACTTGDCTLREAINAANSISGLNLITFANGLSGTIALQAALGPLTVSDTIQINGPGARVLAVSGNENIRVFTINSGVVQISGLTIRDGWNAGNSGDGVSRQGGGIYNQATLGLTNCSFDNNYVQGANNLSSGGNGGAGQGGAIFNNGVLTVSGCTFAANGPSSSGNLAVGGPGQSNSGNFTHGGNGGVGQGGAIFNNAGANVTINNCTFANNSVVGGGGGQDTSFGGGNGGDGSGGAVCNLGTANIVSCTVSANTGLGGSGGQGNNSVNNGSPGLGTGGLINITNAQFSIDDTICATNSGNHGGGLDVYGAFTTGGHNLIGSADHSTGWGGSDQTGTDASQTNPRVQQLGNYGGDTDTFALFFTSSAIDAGDQSAPHRDQRGYFRNGLNDIGAYEFNGNLVNFISVARTGTNRTDITITFEVVKGMSYIMERKPNITDSSWQNLPSGGFLTATGDGIQQLTDSGVLSGNAKMFYHVRLQ